MNFVVEQDLDCLYPVTTRRSVLVNHQLNPRNSKKMTLNVANFLTRELRKSFILKLFRHLPRLVC